LCEKIIKKGRKKDESKITDYFIMKKSNKSKILSRSDGSDNNFGGDNNFKTLYTNTMILLSIHIQFNKRDM
jgi:hypothetical protein